MSYKSIWVILVLVFLAACAQDPNAEIAPGIKSGDIGFVNPPFNIRSSASIPVYGETYERSARNMEEVMVWALIEKRGDMCFIRRDTLIEVEDVKDEKLFIKVIGQDAGGCLHFVGWVPLRDFNEP